MASRVADNELIKVLNLQCSGKHQFEGWFASEDDYAGQSARGMLECPFCGARDVSKLPSAPRLNLSPSVQTEQAPGQSNAATVVDAGTERALQAAWLQVARRILEHTEDVGERFVEEARRMHYGETEERGIRGKASHEDTEALREEGIRVMPLILPEGLEGPVH